MIYDCFTFFNELDILEIRLNELNAYVDKFVLVEATLTHQGKEKPLYYKENKDRFAEFHDKIIHVIVSDYPEKTEDSAWVYEKHQRNSIREGLKNAQPGDFIMISDVDEIPHPKKIATASKMKGTRIFRQHMFYYYLNCINATEIDSQKYFWNGTIMINFEKLNRPIQDYREAGMMLHLKFTPSFIRRLYYTWFLFLKVYSKGLNIKFIENAGWHFSYFGGVDKIIKKLEAFAHEEYNKPEYKDPNRIKQLIANGDDIFGRGFKYSFVKIDESWPSYILNNLSRFSYFIAPTKD